mmetsp:Transcript_91655/g.158934  ORF Transcript_91655/g.158934 Transcript_91655/m.158934 type:complete len:82 (+) Transcript_91655:858-1103(+)
MICLTHRETVQAKPSALFKIIAFNNTRTPKKQDQRANRHWPCERALNKIHRLEENSILPNALWSITKKLAHQGTQLHMGVE